MGKGQVGGVYELSKPNLGDVLPPARSHILNFSKHHHQLQNKGSRNLNLWRTFLIQATTVHETMITVHSIYIVVTDSELYICLKTFVGAFIERSFIHNNSSQDLEKNQEALQEEMGLTNCVRAASGILFKTNRRWALKALSCRMCIPRGRKSIWRD